MVYPHISKRAQAWLGAVMMALASFTVAVAAATPTVAELRQSAQAGDEAAMTKLIQQLMRGNEKDRREAFDWLRRLAEAGNVPAQVGLANNYLHGVPALKIAPNPAEAEAWLFRAAQQDPKILQNLMVLYHDKSAPPQPQHRAAALQRVSDLARSGNAEMQVLAAQVLFEGRISAKDEPGAVQLLRKAAAQGHSEAKLQLADALLRGRGVRQDYAEAAKWVVSAASDGHATAQYNAGVFHRDGVGVTKDLAAAANFFRDAAAKKHEEATLAYAHALKTGSCVEKNERAAATQWRKIARDNAEAAYQLGLAYRDGLGMSKNLEESRRHLRVAHQKKHPEARLALEQLLRKMPFEASISSNVELDDQSAARGNDGRFFQIFTYPAKAGDQLTIKVSGRITDGQTLARGPTNDLKLYHDEGNGRWTATDSLEMRFNFKASKPRRFMITTKAPNRTARADVWFNVVAAKDPGPIIEHFAADYALKKGYVRYHPLGSADRSTTVTIRVSSSRFDPLLAVGLGAGPKDFKVERTDNNSGGGTTALLRFLPQRAGKYTARVSAVGGAGAGSYRLHLDVPLKLKNRNQL